MQFTLKVKFGNEEMQSYADLALATQLLFKRFAQMENEPDSDDSGMIYDLSGNKVGTWTVKE